MRAKAIAHGADLRSSRRKSTAAATFRAGKAAELSGITGPAAH